MDSRKLAIFIVRACLAALVASSCVAAPRAQSAQSGGQELTMSDLLKLPRTVISKDEASPQPGDRLRLKGYRVEEVALPRATEVEVAGKMVKVTKALRITVTGGPFPVRALPAVIWIDDTAVGYGVESEDLDEITAVTYDESLLRDGATLYVSYGDKSAKSGRVQLPVKLKIKKQD